MMTAPTPIDRLDDIVIGYAFRTGYPVTHLRLGDAVIANVGRAALRAWAEANDITVVDTDDRPIVWEGE